MFKLAIINLVSMSILLFLFLLFKKKLERSLFYDIAIEMNLKYIGIPSVLFIINLFAISILHLNIAYLICSSFVYIPLFIRIIQQKIIDSKDLDLKRRVESTILPIVYEEFMKIGIKLHRNCIVLNARNRKIEEFVEIVINLNDKSEDLERLKEIIRKKIDSSLPNNNIMLIFNYKFVPKKKFDLLPNNI